MSNFDSTTIYDKLEAVFTNYERKRVDELLSTAKGSTRVSTDQIQATVGKAQAARELFTLMCNEFNFNA